MHRGPTLRHTYLGCLRRWTPSDLQDGTVCVAVTELLRDTWVSLTSLSAQRSGGRPVGGAMMKVAWGQNVDDLGTGL